MPTDSPLELINSPADLAGLPHHELAHLAEDMRRAITLTVAENGGHLASNLGAVELTLALHRVFDFSRDRLVFDVGHQCYAHKLLTGRHGRFKSLRRRGGLSGFPHPTESAYDPFVVGHASTSVASAAGLADAFARQGRKDRVVAVIGDGALGGGLAFEAMNQAGARGTNLLLVLNDNEMAIAETVGALAAYLFDLRSRPTAEALRRQWESLLEDESRDPDAPADPDREARRGQLLGLMRDHTRVGHLFCALGWEYSGPVPGHDIPALEAALSELALRPGPRLLHVATAKGHGYDAARNDPENFHSPAPFSVEALEAPSKPASEAASGAVCLVGIDKPASPEAARATGMASFTELFAEALGRAAEADDRVVAITAAMPAGTGIREFGKRFPERFVDVGICEAFAVTYAGALAAAGLRPVVAIYSTFLQRGYDQVFHDVAIQPRAPVVFAIDRAGLVGADGPTHHGLYDIAFLRGWPGMTLMSPRDGDELEAMLRLALTLDGPSAIRYPRGAPTRLAPDEVLEPRFALTSGRAEILRDGAAANSAGAGTDVAAAGGVLALGRMVAPSLRAARRVARTGGPSLSVADARFAKPLDSELLTAWSAMPVVYTVEDHALPGGFGSAVAEWYVDALAAGRIGRIPRLVRLGLPEAWIAPATVAEQDAEYGLDEAGLAARFAAADETVGE